MANGPPTPPATTPAELQDEARANSSNSDPTAPPPPPPQIAPENRPEIYQNVMPAIVDAIARNEYLRLVRICEETDYNTASDRQPSRLLIVAPLVLGHLVLNDSVPARYALLRLPDNLASLPLPRALMALVVSTINREHAKVYEQTATLLNLASQPDFIDRDLASVITILLSAFIDAFRHRTFELLSKAYTSLQLSLACTYLGWPEEQVIAIAEKNGWSYDPSTQIFYPGAMTKSLPPRVSAASTFSSLRTFHFVADSVARLEV